MKTLLLASAMALGLSGAAFAGGFSSSIGVSGNFGSSTSGSSYGSVDGGGAVQYGGSQFTKSQSSGTGYAVTGDFGTVGGTYAHSTQQGSGYTTGAGAGGFDYAAGSAAAGQSYVNFAGSYTNQFSGGYGNPE